MEKPIIFPIMRHSDEAEQGAEELISDIKSGKLKRDIDPFLKNDNFFNQLLSDRDEATFGEFLSSETGSLILNALDDDCTNELSK